VLFPQEEYPSMAMIIFFFICSTPYPPKGGL
jgi:hypothetical protein